MRDKDLIDRNNQVVETFRANGGKVPNWGDLILLTAKGAKSGIDRIYPLMSVPYDGTYLAVASKGGATENPAWYNNVVTNPDVTVEVGQETFSARARQLSGEEREKAFKKAIEVFPNYAEYQKKTEREIPVFLLERKTNA